MQGRRVHISVSRTFNFAYQLAVTHKGRSSFIIYILYNLWIQVLGKVYENQQQCQAAALLMAVESSVDRMSQCSDFPKIQMSSTHGRSRSRKPDQTGWPGLSPTYARSILPETALILDLLFPAKQDSKG